LRRWPLIQLNGTKGKIGIKLCSSCIFSSCQAEIINEDTRIRCGQPEMHFFSGNFLDNMQIRKLIAKVKIGNKQDQFALSLEKIYVRKRIIFSSI